MTNEFDANLEGLIRQLDAKEPMMLKSKKLSPRRVRSLSRTCLRKVVAYGDGLWIDKEDMTRAAKALGYVTEIDFWDIREACRNRLKLQRYFSANYAKDLAARAAIKTLQVTLGNIICYSYQAYRSVKDKVTG